MPTPATTAESLILTEIETCDQRIAQLKERLAEELAFRRSRSFALKSLQQTHPTPLCDVVRPIIAELLRDNGSMEFDALYEFVKDRLDGERPANGVKQVVQRLLKEPGIREAEPGVYAKSGE
ncbi:hypothetical protein [Botrimarina mediterranea]|uniref:Uncharacterized protein n=1 Tax=Botrimarina mediterranea TaxID=2528022 RepID=A0A518K271_9BACT|nr:hypothetical protein [Botrimarina mediterranea]QDV71867.1 hypothetical protein Spa11_00360 [Botrimarina mediterranea]